jgi:hypothetical protein
MTITTSSLAAAHSPYNARSGVGLQKGGQHAQFVLPPADDVTGGQSATSPTLAAVAAVAGPAKHNSGNALSASLIQTLAQHR